MASAAMADYQAPGVYRQDVFPPPPPSLLTAVPLFLGYADRELPKELVNVPQRLTLWPQLEALLGPPRADGYLAAAVRGFFENDGVLCYVVPLRDAGSPLEELRAGLAAAEDLDAVDLVPRMMSGAQTRSTASRSSAAASPARSSSRGDPASRRGTT